MSRTILIVDDHQHYRNSLRSLLAREPDLDVVGEAIDGADACGQARELHPDVVLIDLVLPGFSGLEATRQILEDNPNARVLVLSMHVDARLIDAASEAGARGLIDKAMMPAEVLQKIRDVAWDR